MTGPGSKKKTTIAETLEQIRTGADALNQEDENMDNRQAAERALAAVHSLHGVSKNIDQICTGVRRVLKAEDSEKLTRNQKDELAGQAQEEILLALEALAYALGQDEWADEHGFQDPAAPAQTPETAAR